MTQYSIPPVPRIVHAPRAMRIVWSQGPAGPHNPARTPTSEGAGSAMCKADTISPTSTPSDAHSGLVLDPVAPLPTVGGDMARGQDSGNSIRERKATGPIAVLTPSRSGRFSPEWERALAENTAGLDWRPYREVGLPILEARNRTTRRAFDDGAEWFWFLDDDILPPPDALTRLLSRRLDLVSGVCTTRTHPPQVCFARINNRGFYAWGSMEWSWPGEPFPVDVVGLGCLLAGRRVLAAIGPADWFRWDWLRPLPGGRTMRQHKGEDVWFCEQARARGFAVHVDPDVRCHHVDRATGEVHPPATFWARFLKETA